MNRVSIEQRIVARDKKSLLGLVGVLDAEILSELTDEDVTLRLMKIAIRNRDYEGFARIDPYIKTFWNSAAVIDSCIIIDDWIAVLSRLHRLHPGLWWPIIHRDIVNFCKNCRECTKFDEQNLERDLLTAEERRELCESRLRVKVVKKDHQSRDTSPKPKLESTQIANTPYYKSLEQLAKSANE